MYQEHSAIMEVCFDLIPEQAIRLTYSQVEFFRYLFLYRSHKTFLAPSSQAYRPALIFLIFWNLQRKFSGVVLYYNRSPANEENSNEFE